MPLNFQTPLIAAIHHAYLDTVELAIGDMQADPDKDFWTVEYPDVVFTSGDYEDIKDVPKNLGMLLNGRFSKNGQVWDCRVKKSNNELVVKLRVTIFNRKSDVVKAYVAW